MRMEDCLIDEMMAATKFPRHDIEMALTSHITAVDYIADQAVATEANKYRHAVCNAMAVYEKCKGDPRHARAAIRMIAERHFKRYAAPS